MTTISYNIENFKDEIKYFEDDRKLTDNQKEIVIRALNHFLQNEGKWGGFKMMEVSPDERYNVLVTEHSCRHCDVLDIEVTMGVWDNTVARLTLHPKAKEEE